MWSLCMLARMEASARRSAVMGVQDKRMVMNGVQADVQADECRRVGSMVSALKQELEMINKALLENNKVFLITLLNLKPAWNTDAFNGPS